MAIDTSPGSSFMDDFYAECEDHLRDIRRAVLQLENETSEAGKTSALESLFRSFHSLKGILGMAGLPAPEGFAHQTEDYLRALSRNEMAVSNEGIDALLAASTAIEQLVSGHRDGKTAPDSGTLAARLANLTRGPALAP